MSALTDHIAQQHARGERLPLWSLCPVRGCLSFAPGGFCERHAPLARILSRPREAGVTVVCLPGAP